MSVTLSPLAPELRRSTSSRQRPARILFLVAMLGLLAYALYYWLSEKNRAQRFDGLIWEIAARQHLSPYLVKAVIRQESNFRPLITGKAGEIGLMQITAPTVQDWERINGQSPVTPGMLYDPRLNIEVGTWCLARAWQHWARHPQQTELALAQYNAGRSHALRWARTATESDVLANISFPSTKQYIINVIKYRQKFEHGAQARE